MKNIDIIEICKAFDIEIDASLISDPELRLDAYLSFGFTEKAFTDSEYNIREFANNRRMRGNSLFVNPFADRKLKEKYTKEEAKKIIDLWKLEQL